MSRTAPPCEVNILGPEFVIGTRKWSDLKGVPVSSPPHFRCVKCNAWTRLSETGLKFLSHHPAAKPICFGCSQQKPPRVYVPSWWVRIPQIIAEVEALDDQHFYRESISLLFNLSRSMAASLLPRMGAEKLGGMYRISKRDLLKTLHRLKGSTHFQDEQNRQVKLAERLAEVRENHKLRSRPIPVSPESRHKNLNELDGTTMEPGRITISFETPEQALIRLMELSWALGNDYEEFERRVVVTSQENI